MLTYKIADYDELNEFERKLHEIICSVPEFMPCIPGICKERAPELLEIAKRMIKENK